MKPTAVAGDLIERYLFAVRRELPKDLASDVVRELRSLIEDRLQDRAEGSERPDVPEVARLLRDLGAPAKIAQRYRPPRYIVGPAHYPLFMKVVGWILLGAAGLTILTGGVSTVASPRGATALLTLQTWLQMVGLYYQMVIALFAWAVVVFAVLERVNPNAVDTAEDWNPHDLPERPEREDEYFGMAQAVPKICAIGLLAVVVNALGTRLGIPMFRDTTFHLVPLTEFGPQLPLLWVNLWLAALLALRFHALHQRRFTRTMRWIDVALPLAPAAILSWMASQPMHAPASFPDLAPLTRVLPIALWGMALALVVSVVVESIELLVKPRGADEDGASPPAAAA